MILVDSSVFIDAVRKQDRRLLRHFDRYDAAVCGAVRAEILCGIRSATDEVRFVTALDSLFQLPTPEETWICAGLMLRGMSRAGFPLGFADAVIASVAIVNRVPFWSRDKNFQRVTTLTPGLTLIDETLL